MKNTNKTSTLFRSYELNHKANPSKVDALFELYQVYQKEYKFHIKQYWNLFLKNNIKNNKFSHLGSTKHIKTQLNASYLQVLLSQSCASLNNYIANIETKFNHFIQNSFIKDKSLLHKLRTINSKHAWLNQSVEYYPELTQNITDDFGSLITVKFKQLTWIDKESLRLAKKIFNYIIEKQKVRFPNLNKPRLIIDDRLYSLEKSKTSTFDYWLRITALNKGKRLAIPINKNTYFALANGDLGKTIELNFNQYHYGFIQHKHNSLSNSKKNKSKHTTVGKFNKVNNQVRFIFNKKIELEEYFKDKNYQNITKDKTVAFDLGLCNFIATSDGQLFGQYWLDKLKQYDKKITDLLSVRQQCLTNHNKKNPTKKISIKSKRYNGLINQVRGFIKTETNRILNQYFDKNQNIETVVIEKLRFSSPELSRRLNRIVQNFGYNLFKTKLEELSLFYGFKIEELNPAYTSQECHVCGYTDKNNRPNQSVFKCLCCGQISNADVQSSRTNLKRFEIKKGSAYKVLYKGTILRKLKVDFSNNIINLTSNGTVGRRNLYNTLLKNSYFNKDLKEIARTTEDQGLDPMTAFNFDKYLIDFYQLRSKI